jgi:hypothetical protein
MARIRRFAQTTHDLADHGRLAVATQACQESPRDWSHNADMPVALEIFFDHDATAAIRASWQLLEANGIPSAGAASHGRHEPHVTLLNVGSLDVTDSLRRAVAPLIGTRLAFDSLAIFPGSPSVLFLGVRATRPLLEAHAEVHLSITAERTGPWRYYEPGAWVPHCGLALNLGASAVSRAFVLLYPFRHLTAAITEVCAVNTVTGDHAPVSRHAAGHTPTG